MIDPRFEGEELDGAGVHNDEAGEPAERTYRAAGLLAAAGLIATLGLAMLVNMADREVVANTMHADSSDVAVAVAGGLAIPPPAAVLARIRPRDTVYTTDSIYLEVNLKRQNVTVHFRDGSSRTFPVSSGNPYIRDGMATPAGLFTVQNKVPMAISRQFNDARLHHWIGVQGGVGFHGLDGNGYYGHLGVRPSSHGCIRMSKEEIATMYGLVHSGALIMVHNGDPARVVAFCDSTALAGATIIDSAAVHKRGLGRERLRALFEGRFWTSAPPPLVHLARQRFRWGMEIGDAKRIPRQEVPPVTYLHEPRAFLALLHADRTRFSPAGPTLAALVRSGDSIMANRKKEWRDEETKVEYGE